MIQTKPNPRLCVSQKEAARLLDVSVDHFAKLGIPSVRVGGKCKRYRVASLESYLDRQEEKAREI